MTVVGSAALRKRRRGKVPVQFVIAIQAPRSPPMIAYSKQSAHSMRRIKHAGNVPRMLPDAGCPMHAADGHDGSDGMASRFAR
jgi:hypothetical protein